MAVHGDGLILAVGTNTGHVCLWDLRLLKLLKRIDVTSWSIYATGMAAKDPMLVRLGDYLRSVREKKGWSQEGLALECGLHRTYIGAVERGEYNVTMLTLRRITDTLGITVLDAVRGMDKKTPRRR